MPTADYENIMANVNSGDFARSETLADEIVEMKCLFIITNVSCRKIVQG